jgi:uncharacterized protein
MKTRAPLKSAPTLAALLLTATFTTAPAHAEPNFPTEMRSTYERVRPQADYIRREVMIPMRDGVKLFAVVVMKKGVAHGPILLTRTPYDAAHATWRIGSQKINDILPIADKDFVQDGYIRVYEDVRGIHGSEGDYVMTRPLRGSLNPTANDHSTDAYDTIDWLVKNVPETNGKVAITGSSYPGFTSLMALIEPHPALKAAVPMSPMVDGWVGDDWFHNGAFRQPSFDYITAQQSKKGGEDLAYGEGDDYDIYLQAGSAGDLARAYGADVYPFAHKLMSHPSYDGFWQGQAVDKLLGARVLKVPTMLVVGQWDQEDSYGAPAVYKALMAHSAGNAPVSLVIGPWRHSGVNYDGSKLGRLSYGEDTALYFRTHIMKPFLDHYLKDDAPSADTPKVLTYATGGAGKAPLAYGGWQRFDHWPMGNLTPLYFQAGAGLSFEKSKVQTAQTYVSNPADPVPFVPRPVHLRDADVWKPWLVSDQSFVAGRKDVLVLSSAPLTAPLHIAGAPLVDMFAATTASDSDFVVKLIDVYPADDKANPNYQLAVGLEMFRGRYVHGFATPAALVPNKAEEYRFALPNVNHVFLPGHKVMVQVQSSLFPLYDRNPQTYVANIFNAKPQDYVAATQSIYAGGAKASAMYLPVLP